MRYRVTVQFSQAEREMLDWAVLNPLPILGYPHNSDLLAQFDGMVKPQKGEDVLAALTRTVRGAIHNPSTTERLECVRLAAYSIINACQREVDIQPHPEWVRQNDAQLADGGHPLVSDPVSAVAALTEIRAEQRDRARTSHHLLIDVIYKAKSIEQWAGPQDDDDEDL